MYIGVNLENICIITSLNPEVEVSTSAKLTQVEICNGTTLYFYKIKKEVMIDGSYP